MSFTDLTTYLWLALAILVLGSVYLIILGYKVSHLFADSIVGRLVKALVAVFLIEIYSLGVVCLVLIKFYPKGIVILLPIVMLWIVSLGFALFAIRSAGREMSGLIK